jgi:hypothetical protein
MKFQFKNFNGRGHFKDLAEDNIKSDVPKERV